MSLVTNRIAQPLSVVLRNTTKNLTATKSPPAKFETESDYLEPTQKIKIPLGQIIDTLELIADERSDNHSFGFKPTPKSKGDLLLSKRANNIKEAILFNPSKKNIQIALNFLELNTLIETLESIYKEKLQMDSMGFHAKSKSKKEIKLGEDALKLAEILKLSPTKENIEFGYQYLNFVSEFESRQQTTS